MAVFQVTVNISPEVVKLLKERGYSLYVFKAVRSSGKGQPTVWFNIDMNVFLSNNTITWEEKEYRGYASMTPVMPGAMIMQLSNILTNLGDLITIDKNGMLQNTSRESQSGTISFLNKTSQEFTVGIAQNSTPFCAFPILDVDSALVIMPISKILLIFSAEMIPTSTVILQAMSSGVFIDLTDVGSRQVNYDIEKGWSTDPPTAPWMKSVSASDLLAPLLIEKK